jgi:hypothetical protein
VTTLQAHNLHRHRYQNQRQLCRQWIVKARREGARGRRRRFSKGNCVHWLRRTLSPSPHCLTRACLISIFAPSPLNHAFPASLRAQKKRALIGRRERSLSIICILEYHSSGASRRLNVLCNVLVLYHSQCKCLPCHASFTPSSSSPRYHSRSNPRPCCLPYSTQQFVSPPS